MRRFFWLRTLSPPARPLPTLEYRLATNNEAALQRLQCRIVDLASDGRARRPDWNQLTAKAVVRSIVRISVVPVRIIIPVVRIIIPIVGVIIQKGTSKKEIVIVPEMISVLEAIPVLEMPSSVFRKAMATKTTPGKPSEMATAETATGTEMTTATGEMAAATTEASTMPATSSAMAAASSASSAVSECGGGRNRQNTGQNQTGKETVK